MTPRLPPDIDRMLWEIAESQDQNAYDDFEKRFPNLVGELGKRIQLVRELRDARGNGSGRPVPSFDRRVPTQVGLSRPALMALCTAAVICTGIFAYAITAKFMGAPPKITPPPYVNVEPPVLPSVGPTTTSGGAPDEGSRRPKLQNPPPVVQNDVPQYMKPQNVKLDRAKLQIAILLVATGGKLQVEFAPNMPNPEIRMDYRNMSAIDILKDLGPRFGFTAFTQGGNRILVVPAVDPNSSQLPPATGSGYAANLESDQPPTEGQGSGTPKKARTGSTTGPS
jgi:hypothetical protein